MLSAHPRFGEAFRFWLRLGFISFGGPAGQIAVMHTELVERKRWIDEERFLHALNFCMLLPGPEATQLAIYCGWLLHGLWGGIVAGVLFVLPAALLLWGLSVAYVTLGHLAAISAVFEGLKPAVTAIVAAAVLHIGQRALKTPTQWLLAAGAFVALFVFHAPFPAIIVAAALVGAFAPGRKAPAASGGAARVRRPLPADDTRPSLRRAATITAVSLALWAAPIVVAGIGQGWNGVLARQGIFFSKAALVTFGGAYAVLPYVAQEAVQQQGWLTATQMLDGLGLAETTPGPLIMVVQFVGFLGGWNHPGGLTPLTAATLAALMTTWTTFVPCFLWILAGAPYVERLRENEKLSGALAAVTSAVVGVVLNLAVWFGWHMLRPRDGSLNYLGLAIGIAAFVALRRFKFGIVTVVVGSGLIGLAWRLWIAPE